MTTKTIAIDPRVALTEESALVDHYRNRALVLAQTLFERDLRIAGLQAEMEGLKADPGPSQPFDETEGREE